MIQINDPFSFQLIRIAKFGIAKVTWQQYINSEYYQKVYWQLADFMENNKLSRAIIDIRGRGEAPYSDQVWLCREFLPAVLPRIKKQLRLAYLVQPDYYQILQAESPDGGMETLSELLTLQIFVEEQVALDWLSQKEN